MKRIILLVSLVLPLLGHANPISSANNGAWSTPGTWVGGVVPGSGDDVTITGGTTVTITDNRSVHNLTIATSGTLAFTGSYTLTIGGNFTDNATFNAGTGTVVFNNGQQSISSASGITLITFYNLTENDQALFLYTNIKVNNNLAINSGTLRCQTQQITGNTSGTFSMQSGTGLILGLQTSSTNVYFPFKFTSIHINLYSNSTVTYGSNGNQTVSDTATYANLTLTTGSSAVTKTAAGGSSVNLTVAGNLLINGNVTFAGLGGGTLYVGGNLTNNGSYTEGTGTVNLDGSGTQALGGTNAITFYNLTQSGTGTVQLGYNLYALNNLSLTAGDLDVTSNDYAITVKGNFTCNGGSCTPHGNVTRMNGTSGTQTLGGTSKLDLYKLVINSGGNTTLGGSVSAGGDFIDSTTFNSSSDTLFVGGNLYNYGTFNAGTGTVDMDGSGTQNIGGTAAITSFHNLTIASTGTVYPTYNLTISNNLAISSGTFDMTGSGNYNVTVGGNFTKTGGTYTPHGNTVTMNGSSPTLGGSSTITMNKLVIATSGTTTLGGDISLTDSLRINPGATLTGSTHNISLDGDFIDKGTFTCASGTVSFDNNGKQCIKGTHSTETFKNLTVGGTSILGTTCSYLNLTGLVTIMPGGKMACTCN